MNETNKTLNIEGMSCQHCVGHVEEALRGVDGVQRASANLDQEQVTVDFSPKMTDLNSLEDAVREAGFEVVGVAEQPEGKSTGCCGCSD